MPGLAVCSYAPVPIQRIGVLRSQWERVVTPLREGAAFHNQTTTND